MGQRQRYFVNPINLTLYCNRLIGVFHLPDLFHHLISSHLCAVVYVLGTRHTQRNKAARAAESFPEVTTFNLLILQLQSASSIKEDPRKESRNLDQHGFCRKSLLSLSVILFLSISGQESHSQSTFFLPHRLFSPYHTIITILLPLLRILACSLQEQSKVI